jgi:IS30 family transposase
MSFQVDLERYRGPLLRMVDAGGPVRSAALSLGISGGRAYEILRVCGRGAGPKTVITDEHREVVLSVFAASGSVNRAALAARLSHNAARRILVTATLIPQAPRPSGKAAARARFTRPAGCHP